MINSLLLIGLTIALFKINKRIDRKINKQINKEKNFIGNFHFCNELLNDKKIKIDSIVALDLFTDGYIEKYEIVDIKLKDLKFKTDEYINCKMNYINGDKTKYIKTQTNNRFGHSEERFDNLINSVNKQGYNYKISPIIVDNNNQIIDGYHRTSILLNKYGKEHNIKVLKIYYVNN